MTLSSTDSWTEPATMVASMCCRTHARLAWDGGAGDTDHPIAVGDPDDRQPDGGVTGSLLDLHRGRRTGCSSRSSWSARSCCTSDQHLGVQDLNRPAGQNDLDVLTSQGGADRVGESSQADLLLGGDNTDPGVGPAATRAHPMEPT